MELNKVSLEQWQDIETLIQLVVTYGLIPEVAFQIIGRIPHVTKGYREDTDLYKNCVSLLLLPNFYPFGASPISLP